MPSLPADFVKADELDANVKIYCLRTHPAQPHIFLLITSIGLVVVSIAQAQVSFPANACEYCANPFFVLKNTFNIRLVHHMDLRFIFIFCITL